MDSAMWWQATQGAGLFLAVGAIASVAQSFGREATARLSVQTAAARALCVIAAGLVGGYLGVIATIAGGNPVSRAAFVFLLAAAFTWRGTRGNEATQGPV